MYDLAEGDVPSRQEVFSAEAGHPPEAGLEEYSILFYSITHIYIYI